MWEETRYKAQCRLKEVGPEGQKRLSEAHILIVGCGALGSPLGMYLAGAGIGKITLADFDTVDPSNLHRQVFYNEGDVGKYKAEILAEKMKALNSGIDIHALNNLITKKKLKEMEGKYDMIIDAADNPSTTYLLDEYCRVNSIPLSTAGVTEWQAQIFTFVPGGKSYSDIFPQPEEEAGILPCSVAGIVGPVAALASAVQGAEVIKTLLGIENVTSRLITANLLTGEFMKVC